MEQSKPGVAPLSLLAAALLLGGCAERDASPAPPWVESMKHVHARFTGTRGTLAHFGDSIAVSQAFWSRLRYEHVSMPPDMAPLVGRVKSYLRPECWDQWKGADHGNDGAGTVDWALANADRWLARLNPEAVLIQFGAYDMRKTDAAHFEQGLRLLVERCLANGSVVILMTPPPQHGRLEQSKEFAEAVRRVAAEARVPLVDYQAAILERRPTDWDGAAPEFRHQPGDGFQVPTLISSDGFHPSNPAKYGDYTEEGLRNNGYLLRTYLTLEIYADVLDRVLRPSWSEASELGRWLWSFARAMVVVAVAAAAVLGLERLLLRGRRGEGGAL
jgi:hypothetical protein